MASQLVEGTGGPQEGPPPAMPHMVWTPDWGQAVPGVETAAAWPLTSPCTRGGRAYEVPSSLLDFELPSASPGSATDLLWDLGLVPQHP